MNLEHNRYICENRLNRARETLEEANTLFHKNYLAGTANRIYYSMFYAVSALAQANDFTTSKHTSLLGWFNKTYIHTGIIESQTGEVYRKAFDLRSKGDYSDLNQLDAELVEELLQKADNFIKKIEILTIQQLEKLESND